MQFPNRKLLLDILKKALKTNYDLDFLLRLTAEELKMLVLCVRDRVDRPWEGNSQGGDSFEDTGDFLNMVL